jgi:glycosyltransferase involved in cell wall biosynthesis
VTRPESSSPGLRVVVVSPRYAPDIGGVEQVAERNAQGASGRGIQVEVLTTDPTGRLPRLERIGGIPVRRFPTILGDAIYFVSPRLAWWLYRRPGRYDLIHVHSYHTALALAVAAVSRLNGVPYVVTAHYHGTGHTGARRALHVLYAPLGRWMLRSARAIVCASEAEAALVRRQAGEGLPITIVPPGIEVGEIRDALPLARDTGRSIVLGVGRLEPYKQTGRLLDALPLLPGTVDVVLVGDGPARADLEAQIATRGLEGRARMLGAVPRPELLAWYRTADVLVTLSRHEAFGIVIAEAGAAGLTIVASDIPSHREVAAHLPDGQVRFVSPDCSPADLAEAVGAAVGSPPRAPGAASLPTWDDAADHIVTVYGSILSASRAPVDRMQPGDGQVGTWTG